MSYETTIEAVNQAIRQYHAKRAGNEGLTLDEAIEAIKKAGFSEGDARRWLHTQPPRR